MTRHSGHGCGISGRLIGRLAESSAGKQNQRKEDD